MRRILGADTGEVSQFWRGLRSSPDGQEFWESHGILRNLSPADLAYTLPLVLHEDAGPYGKSTSVAILNYSSILGRGAELECKLVSAAFTKGDNAKPLPTDRGWAMFLESIGHVLRGVAPLGPFEIDTVDYRMAGRPIMKLEEETWNGLMLFGKADSEHQVLSWGSLIQFQQHLQEVPGESLRLPVHRWQ